MPVGQKPFKACIICLLAGFFLLISLGGCTSGQAVHQARPSTQTASQVSSMTLTPPVISPDVQERGFDLIPASPDDYSSQATLNALREMRNLGANAVTLTTTYYTDSLTSSIIHSGRYTASDASLSVVIKEAQALGLEVNIAVYVDPATGEWRAYLAPDDRSLWFSEYAGILDHLAALSQQHRVHRLCIGVEMISLSTATQNPDNTTEWENLIHGVRSYYSGLVMYAANWGGASDFGKEYAHIQFWQALDEVGIDGYFPLGSSPHPTFSELEYNWGVIHDSVLVPLSKSVQKPLVFEEVGYRSIVGTTLNPNDSVSQGAYDDCEQATAYYALLDAWKDSKLLAGIFWWYWETSPKVGGIGDTSYSPRFKSAAVILAMFWQGSDADGDEEAVILHRCGLSSFVDPIVTTSAIHRVVPG